MMIMTTMMMTTVPPTRIVWGIIGEGIYRETMKYPPLEENIMNRHLTSDLGSLRSRKWIVSVSFPFHPVNFSIARDINCLIIFFFLSRISSDHYDTTYSLLILFSARFGKNKKSRVQDRMGSLIKSKHEIFGTSVN